ncbi:MAG: hypothetical protein CMI55_00020 [Parcubacteria group bacterium]|nr:hypothetical protein [Parcubacteria group bacterium]
MKYWYKAVLVLSFTLLFASVLVMAGTIMAPYIGLGSKENFLLYSLANITRRQSGMIGFWGMILGIFGVISGAVGSQKYSRVQGTRIAIIISVVTEHMVRSQIYKFLAIAKEARGVGKVPKKPLFVILTFSGLAQLYYFGVPIFIDCDAAMFIKYAEALVTSGGVVNLSRPPGFPLFLALSGTFLFDTPYVVVALQMVMGSLIPPMIYSILYILGPRIAFIAAVASILSTLPFTMAKYMLSDHLFMFLGILSVYWLVRFYKTNKALYIVGTVAISTAMWFTRWEGLLLFVCVLLALGLLVAKRRRHWRVATASLSLPILSVAVWSFGLYYHTGESAMLGRVSIGTGYQLMYQGYIAFPGRLKGLNIGYDYDIGNLPMVKLSLTHDDFGYAIISPSNGPATKRLHDRIARLMAEKPLRMERLKVPLAQAYQHTSPPIDLYQVIFGQFSGDPIAFADSFFEQSSLFQLDFVREELNREDGYAATDDLFKEVYWEGWKKHWRVLVVPTLPSLMGGFGVNINSILMSILGKEYLNPFFALWSEKSYFPDVHNVAGCPESLRKEFFDDYTFDYFTFMDSAWMNIIRKTEVLRNLFRNVVGPLFVISSLIVIFSRHARLFVPIALGAGAMSVSISFLLPDLAGSRYEVMILLLMMMVCAAAVNTVKSWFFSKSSASSQI